jgi:hypothetical protein
MASPAGQWRLSGPRRAIMRIWPDGDGWRISLLGGSDSRAGAAAAADCELEAAGVLAEGTLAARVIPFEGKTRSVTAAELARTPATVTIRLTPKAAEVSTTYQGCGLGANLNGAYTRASADRR